MGQTGRSTGLLSKQTSITLVCGLLLLLAIGCGKSGSNRSAISGNVTLDGKPIEHGSILFTPIEGTKGTVAGGPIEGGQYRLANDKGPAIGQNRVEIHAMRQTGKMVQKPLAPRGEMIEESVEAIPPRFNSASTLKTQIQPGENTANFDVVSK